MKIKRFNEKFRGELQNLVIGTFVNFAGKLYPDSKFEVKEKSDDLKLVIWENIEELGIKRLNSRFLNQFVWFSIENRFNAVSVGFDPIYSIDGVSGLLYNELIELDINKFLIDIVTKYKYIGNLSALTVENKDIQKMLDEITLEDYEIYTDANKYNL